MTAPQLDRPTPAGAALVEVAAQLFTISEASVLLHVPEGWLRKKVSAQSVPHTRLGKHVRFTHDHLQRIVGAGERSTAAAAERTNGVSARARRRAEATGRKAVA